MGESFLLVLIGAALWGLIPAVVANRKGHSAVLWWVYGMVLFPVALIHAILLPPDRHAVERQQAAAGYRKCPACAEMVKAEATRCRYCQEPLPPDTAATDPPPAEAPHGRFKTREEYERWKAGRRR